MKTISSIFAVLCFLSMTAQEHGRLKGKVTDVNTGLDIPFANVILLTDSGIHESTSTNLNGEYLFSKVDTTDWNLRVEYVGYQTKVLQAIRIKAGKITVIDVALSAGTMLNEVEIIGYRKPLVQTDQTRVESTVTREEIQRMAVRSASDIAKTAGNGVYSRDNGTLNVRGSRSNNNVNFIDGIKVVGSTTIPATAIEEVTVHISGVPAQFENDMMLEDSEVIITPNAPNGRRLTKAERKRLKEDRLFSEAEEIRIYENELYQEIADNPFESPIKTPLSTFSIDVDRAAYANVRRFLNRGHMPPVNAVRVEEMINYFNYDYPNAEGEHPFTISTEIARSPWNAERQIALIGVQGMKIEKEDAPPSNLVFLVDVSGSMSSYDKLDLLVKGMKLLVDELRDEDRVAIVVYAGAAGVVLNSTPGSEKAKIKEVLNQFEAGGSTAGGAGIQLAYKIAKQNFIEEGNNRVILATDGDFNVGTSTQEGLVRLIEEKRESGVFLSVLGFGNYNLQDYKMEQLANKGNGNYNYIDNLMEAQKVLVSEMGGTLITIAKDVKIQAEFNPAKVKAYRLIGYVNRELAPEDFNDDLKDAGELGSGHSVTALYEIVPVGSKERIMDVDSLKYQKNPSVASSHSDDILTVKFRYKQPNGEKSILITRVLKDEQKNIEDASANLRFSAAVASFGMKLRGSESVKEFDYKAIADLGKSAKGVDDNGYRSEFIKLVETAGLLARKD